MGEQLHVCTDGTVPVDAFLILNQVATGGELAVDRVGILEIP